MIKSKFVCRICGSETGLNYSINELMFGLNDQFIYWECNDCGCLQIEQYPSNINKYYPKDYYSFELIDYAIYNFNGFKHKIKTFILLYNQLVFKNFLGNLGIDLVMPCRYRFEYLAKINAKPWHKILDVGCGNATFLCELYKIGFAKLTGVDKFIENDFKLFGKIKVLKRELHELSEKFDIITMHHVLEHMPFQSQILKLVYERLNKNGLLILRIPIKNKAWKIYKENWVQLDSPRHFYLHTIESIKILSEQAGFSLQDIEFDSYSLQFWGSEQYKLNIPLRRDHRSYAENKNTSLFTSKQISDWEVESIKLNETGEGDQGIFIFRKNGQ